MPERQPGTWKHDLAQRVKCSFETLTYWDTSNQSNAEMAGEAWPTGQQNDNVNTNNECRYEYRRIYHLIICFLRTNTTLFKSLTADRFLHFLIDRWGTRSSGSTSFSVGAGHVTFLPSPFAVASCPRGCSRPPVTCMASKRLSDSTSAGYALSAMLLPLAAILHAAIHFAYCSFWRMASLSCFVLMFLTAIEVCKTKGTLQ